MRLLSFVQARHFRVAPESPPTRKLLQNRCNVRVGDNSGIRPCSTLCRYRRSNWTTASKPYIQHAVRGDSRRSLLNLGWRVEIDEISIRVTEVNGTSPPRLCGRGLNPSFHSALQSSVLLIDVGDPEFQDNTLVLCCLSRARNIPLLSLFRENRQHSYARPKLSIVFTGPLRFTLLVIKHVFISVGMWEGSSGRLSVLRGLADHPAVTITSKIVEDQTRCVIITISSQLDSSRTKPKSTPS
jgi:hypothetical protein